MSYAMQMMIHFKFLPSAATGRNIFKSLGHLMGRPFNKTSSLISNSFFCCHNFSSKSSLSSFQSIPSQSGWKNYSHDKFASKSECNIHRCTRLLYISSRTKQNRINIKTKSDDKSKTSSHNSPIKNSIVNNHKESTDKNKIVIDNKNGVSSNDQNGASKSPTEPVDQKVVKEGIFTRFKNTYKQHGKIFIGVHLVTSAMWTGMFYYAVVSGVDVVAMLDWMGVSQTVIDKLKSPSLGYIAATYLLYKLATPLRYTVTIVGTRWVVKYLQKSGKMPTTPEENKISSLLKEGGMNMKKRPRLKRKK